MSFMMMDVERVFRSGDMEGFGCYGMSQGKNVVPYLPMDLAERYDEKESIPFSQALGEAIIVFTQFLSHIHMGEAKWGDICWDDQTFKFFLEMRVDSAWREAEAVNAKLGSFRAVMYGEDIQIAAYDVTGKYLPSRMEFPKQYSKTMPEVGILIASDMILDEDFGELVKGYAASPNRDDFFRIYFYLKEHHGYQQYELKYDRVTAAPFKNANSLLKIYTAGASICEEEPQIKEVNIKQFDQSSLNKDYLNLIPKLGDEFVFPAKLINLANAFADGDIKSVLLHGPAGTGKTMSCKLIAEKTGLPLMDTINCTENLDEFVLGKYIPEGDHIIFKESYVTKAIREGGAVVFEEINFAKPQYLSFLNSLLDDNGFVRLDNGEVVKRHPNFRFMATMNVGYFGTRELNQALYNRFQAIVEIKDLSDEAIKKMLTERVPECAGFIDNALELYHQIKDKIHREELDVVISPRNLENWMRLCKYEPVEDAAEKTIIPIAKGDRDMETDLRLMIKQCINRG